MQSTSKQLSIKFNTDNKKENQHHLFFFMLIQFYQLLGYRGVKLVFNNFDSAEHFFGTSLNDLKQFFAKYLQLDAYYHAEDFLNADSQQIALNKAKDFLSHLAALDGYFLTKHDSDFPNCMLKVPLSIDWIFYHSRQPLNKFNNNIKDAIAIVGTRRCTNYGRENTSKIVRALVNNKITIVSGLADGIDAEAHKMTIDLGGTAIAVLGTGINKMYPEKNSFLLKEIINNNGAVFTEFLPSSRGNRQTFILRNRIIAAISKAVIAIEGNYNSGTAYTIKFAAEMQKKIIGIEYNKKNTINDLIKNLGGKIFKIDEVDKILNYIEN